MDGADIFWNATGLSIGRRTTSQRLLANYEEKLLNFQKYVLTLRKTCLHPLAGER